MSIRTTNHYHYVVQDTSIGMLFVAATCHGVCLVRLGDDAESLIAACRAQCVQCVHGVLTHVALETHTTHHIIAWSNLLAECVAGTTHTLFDVIPIDRNHCADTPFQQQVWDALCLIPYGETRTYREVAQMIHRPTAVRAVARACSANPVPIIVPCHRVIRSNGTLGGYSSGIARKQALLALEARTSL